MTLGQVALKPIDEPSLGRAEDEPVVTRLLQVDKELLTTVFCFLVDIVPAIEFGLSRSSFSDPTTRSRRTASATARSISAAGTRLIDPACSGGPPSSDEEM